MTVYPHPYDARPSITRALAAVEEAVAFAASSSESVKPDYPAEVRTRLDAAGRELRAALASCEVVEGQRERRRVARGG